MKKLLLQSLFFLTSFSALHAMEEPKVQASSKMGLMLFNMSKLPATYASQDKPDMALAMVNKLPGRLLNYRDETGKSALHYAAQKGYETLARTLLEKGADYTTADVAGDTPLELAQKNDHDVIAQLIMAKVLSVVS